MAFAVPAAPAVPSPASPSGDFGPRHLWRMRAAFVRLRRLDGELDRSPTGMERGSLGASVPSLGYNMARARAARGVSCASGVTGWRVAPGAGVSPLAPISEVAELQGSSAGADKELRLGKAMAHHRTH